MTGDLPRVYPTYRPMSAEIGYSFPSRGRRLVIKKLDGWKICKTFQLYRFTYDLYSSLDVMFSFLELMHAVASFFVVDTTFVCLLVETTPLSRLCVTD